MEQYFEEYMSRSVLIRNLSMPPESQCSDAARFYRQFVENYISIKGLLQENRAMLDRKVYALLKRIPDISEETAAELMDFSDKLADTRTLEMVDVRLGWVIADQLMPFYVRLLQHDDSVSNLEKYIHCLYRRQVLAYNVGQTCDRGKITEPICQPYWDCIEDSMEKARPYLEDISVFATLSQQTQNELLTMELFSATAYERLYYDEKLIRKQIACYQRHIQRLSDPAFQKVAPSEDIEFDIFSGYAYLMQIQEFLYWVDAPEDILQILDEAATYTVAYIHKYPDNHRVDLQYAQSSQQIVEFYLGQYRTKKQNEAKL